MLAALTAGVHLIAVLGLIAGVLIIMLASAPSISAQDLKAINRIYILTGAALLVAATAGVLLWLVVGKPAEFYSNNPIFHAKLGLFVALLAVLAYTGFKFRQLQKQHRAGMDDAASAQASVTVKNSIRRMQKICVPLVIVIPALAWMMARGIGY